MKFSIPLDKNLQKVIGFDGNASNELVLDQVWRYVFHKANTHYFTLALESHMGRSDYSKSDHDICESISENLNFNDDFIYGVTTISESEFERIVFDKAIEGWDFQLGTMKDDDSHKAWKERKKKIVEYVKQNIKYES